MAVQARSWSAPASRGVEVRTARPERASQQPVCHEISLINNAYKEEVRRLEKYL